MFYNIQGVDKVFQKSVNIDKTVGAGVDKNKLFENIKTTQDFITRFHTPVQSDQFRIALYYSDDYILPCTTRWFKESDIEYLKLVEPWEHDPYTFYRYLETVP